jgi:acylphosphatase
VQKSEPKAFHVFVHGRVQGVGFRYSAIREAVRLQVRGMVRNCEDGDVEIVAEGDPERLERFLQWLREGPLGAYVRNVEITEIPYSGAFKRFDVEF